MSGFGREHTMKHLSVMIKPASSICNFRCKYCFYADVADLRSIQSYGIVSLQNVERMLRNLESQLQPGDSIAFAFQGGEPTLAGLDWFRDFVRLTDKWDAMIHISFALQTNGSGLNDAWCQFLAERHFLVGLSLDILKSCHDDVRIDTTGRGTYGSCIQALKKMERYGVEYNVLCTLTKEIARHPRQVWKAILDLDLRFTQFTPCLDALDTPGKNPYALIPTRFYQFYSQMFPLWLADFQKGKYRSIKLFDDVINLLAFGVPTACGIHGHCQPQIVVEADGSVYPCDFYCLDQYRIGNIFEDSIDEILAAAASSSTQVPDRLPGLCTGCGYLNFCHGGCKRMRSEIACDENSVVCGYGKFLDEFMPTLQEIAKQQQMSRKLICDEV